MQVILTELEYNELLNKTKVADGSDSAKLIKENTELKQQLRVFTTGYDSTKVKINKSISLDLLDYTRVSLVYNLDDLPSFMQYDISTIIERQNR